MPPLVSVIASVCNLEDIVLETVHSVLDQTMAGLELVVVDDGSTDRSGNLVASIDDPFRSLPHQSGINVAGSRSNLVELLTSRPALNKIWRRFKKRCIHSYQRHDVNGSDCQPDESCPYGFSKVTDNYQALRRRPVRRQGVSAACGSTAIGDLEGDAII